MNTTSLNAQVKQLKLLFGISILTAFMAAMKALGVFEVGALPRYVEAAFSAFALIYAIVLAAKISKAKHNEAEDSDPT